MDSNEFKHELTSSFIYTYEKIRKGFFNGKIQFPNKPTYNSQLRIAETKEHLIGELLGSKSFKKHKEAEIVTRAIEKVSDINHFILGTTASLQGVVPLLDVNDGCCDIGGVCLVTAKDIKDTESRLGIHIQKNGLTKRDANIPIIFRRYSGNSLLHQVELLRTNNLNVYYRWISVLIIIRKSESRLSFRNWLRIKLEREWREGRALGIEFSSDDINVRMARSLISLSEQSLSERVIDKYISQHASIFAKSMGYVKALPQIELKWISREDGDPYKSIPDYFMESTGDGSYHIVDLKKGWLGRKIVKGKTGRERFIDYVSELVAQLKNYERYFDKADNRDYAKSKYGIEISNEIKLIGIVGGYYEYDELSVS